MYEKFARSDWFRHDRFGMFIHWGLYAIPARGEWVRSPERLTVEDYQPYFDSFNPVDYDPRAWARAAKAAGMKYAVMTAKHHDGFCLFDSQLTDYKSTKTPAGRDLVREYLDAFRAEGLKVGLYYSIIDWHHPDYPHYGDAHHPMRDNPAWRDAEHDFANYLRYMHGQVHELCTQYGRLDIMWFDFSYDNMTAEKWEAEKLVRMIREHQPDVLLDNRLEASGGSFGSLIEEEPTFWSGDFASPEQIIPPQGILNRSGDPIPWEACVTMNQNWGYSSRDRNFKPASVVVRKLVECVSKNGNLLLNVGPDARGRIPDESLAILAEVGRWMDRNSTSIYGCLASPLAKPEWGRYTQRGSTLYAHVFDVPIGPLHLPGVADSDIAAVRLLADGSELEINRNWLTDSYEGETFIALSPVTHDCRLPDEIDTVIEIRLKT